eukprot:1147205-Pelagomonas_calceolata.AAC.3
MKTIVEGGSAAACKTFRKAVTLHTILLGVSGACYNEPIDQYAPCDRLVTTRRDGENENAPHSQALEPGEFPLPAKFFFSLNTEESSEGILAFGHSRAPPCWTAQILEGFQGLRRCGCVVYGEMLRD